MAITALTEEKYSQFPALVSLAVAIKPDRSDGGAAGTNPVEKGDLENVRKLLEAAARMTPRFTENGKVAVYTVPGYRLPEDELKLIRLRGKWYFVVD